MSAYDVEELNRAFARLTEGMAVPASRIAEAMAAFSRIAADAAEYERSRPACRLCGGTIELGCCTRCGVPEETR